MLQISGWVNKWLATLLPFDFAAEEAQMFDLKGPRCSYYTAQEPEEKLQMQN